MTALSKLSDRELLELAAETGGYVDGWSYCEHGSYGKGMYRVEKNTLSFLNTLKDPGHALALASAREIDVLFRVVGGRRALAIAPGGPTFSVPYKGEYGRIAATCRAITLAAADLALAKRNSDKSATP